MKYLLKFELKKAVRKKLFWWLFFTALLLNLTMLWWTNKGDIYNPGFKDYKALYDKLRPLSNTEKLDYLQNEKDTLDVIRQKENFELSYAEDPDSPFAKSEAEQYAAVYKKYSSILDRKQDYRKAERKSKVVNHAIGGLKTIMGYPEYLAEIRENASRLSGFSIFKANKTDGFSPRNIMKTLKDYSTMNTVKPIYDIDKGIRLIVDFPTTDIFIALLITAVCLFLITDEKERGIFALIKCTKYGRGSTIAAKIAALFIISFFTNAAVFISTVVFAQVGYGLGDLSRTVQSLPDMIGSTLHISVGQYLLLFFIIKTIGFTAVGLIILLIANIVDHPILVVAETILLAFISVFLYMIIPISSGFNWFKILNLCCLVSPNKILNSYYNLNLFGYPVNSISVFFIFIMLMLAFFTISNIFAFIMNKELLSCKNFRLKLIPDRIRFLHIHAHSNLAWYEARKIAGINFAALIIILFAVLQLFSMKNDRIVMTAEDYYYRHYMIMLSGRLTPNKESFLKSEKAKYDAVHAEIEKINKEYENGEITWDNKIDQENSYNRLLNRESSFLKVYNRYIYIKNHPDTQFVYDLGYEKLFGITEPDSGLTSGIKLVIVLTLCLSGVFSMEYRTGMIKVLASTQKGVKDTVLCKLFISIIISVILFVSAYVSDVVLIGRTYGFDGLSASLSSLPSFECFKCFSILGYIILLFTTRLIVCFAVSCMILTFSLLIRNTAYTAIASICVLTGPPLMHLLGIHIFDHLSLIPLLTTNTYYLFSQSIYVSFLQIAVAATFTFLSLFTLFKQFGKNDTLKFCI